MPRRKYFPERGQRFGRLTVIDPEARKSTRSQLAGVAAVVCRCDCGTIVTVPRGSLFRGATRSCGCLIREAGSAKAKALARHPARLAWARSAENASRLRSLGRGIGPVQAMILPLLAGAGAPVTAEDLEKIALAALVPSSRLTRINPKLYALERRGLARRAGKTPAGHRQPARVLWVITAEGLSAARHTGHRPRSCPGLAGRNRRRVMSEPVTTRESELEARARKAGLTLIRPPADNWVVIFDSNAGWDACAGLDEVEEIIAANEGTSAD